ncbi:MAG: cytoplasmic protein [Deltaproteobacteria bacterium]|nr:cytoplasmic protein [Candidatus Anaeroferrophillacea bacterium]
MLKNELIMRNPLRILGNDTDDLIPAGGCGAVVSRAGVGKTSLLVQIALNSMLRDQQVLHISIDDPVRKVNLWYKEMLQDLADRYQVQQINELWERVLPYRFIMAFHVDGFSVPRLRERLEELREQDIFTPQVLLIDGLPLDDERREMLAEVKVLATDMRMHVWFSILSHRHEEPAADGLPLQLAGVADRFDVILQLQPEGKDIFVRALKGPRTGEAQPTLQLDPTTMLIKTAS